jgi:hypothetical protein
MLMTMTITVPKQRNLEHLALLCKARKGGRHQDRRKELDKRACRGRVER